MLISAFNDQEWVLEFSIYLTSLVINKVLFVILEVRDSFNQGKYEGELCRCLDVQQTAKCFSPRMIKDKSTKSIKCNVLTRTEER